ncbi:MAG: hypothetical protein IPO85_11950 [Saprospiraceae bacterium]|uniref:NrS-1 polymerase-like helicase domain-containing protein n=1 Tax=Candidatus Defluviibacterium haderslevense TaxID=2981993 RepID=A0A9D7S924_9BACT|nr:hypothetical protein [Candidatus Defluviibacterium haderslevense]
MTNFAQSEIKRMNYDPITMQLSINVDPEGGGKVRMCAMFAEKEDGNLAIFFPNLNGYLKVVKEGKSYRPKFISKIKHGVDDLEWDYGPNMEGLELFIPPHIFNCYKSKIEIKHLIITDDPVTAYILSNNEIPAIAIPGLPFLKDISIPNQIVEAILDICTECSVSNITYLVPSDILEVTWIENIDLGIRPRRIFNSLWNIYLKICYNNQIRLLFAYPQEKHPNKRVCRYFIDEDDFFTIETIKSELYTKNPERGLLIVHDLKHPKMSEVKKIFSIDGTGATFYETYCKEIQQNQFIYNRSVFQFDFDELKATYVKSMESNQFICINGTYFIKLVIENESGSKSTLLEKFPEDAFSKKFTRLSKETIKVLKSDISFYDKSGNKPDHINYVQDWEVMNEDTGVPSKYYNTYSKLLHKPKKGDCQISLDFLKHIFGSHEMTYKGVTYKGYELGLDYCKLLYCRPTNFLPILCLVSQQRITGKTTFWDWKKEIYAANATSISANDINSQFTGLYAGKLLGVFEETFIDKVSTVEKLKELVTSKKVKLEKKGIDSFEVYNYIKIGISSNKINNFAPVDQEEVRFWVRDIPPIPGGENVNYKPTLFQEIPAFLHHLQEIDYHTDNETRSWFANELIYTEALGNIKAKSRPQNEILIERSIHAYMIQFRRTWCNLSAKDIRDLCDEKDLTLKSINYVLETRWNKAPTNRGNKYIHYSEGAYSQNDDTVPIHEEYRKGEYYTFTLSDFCSPHQIIYDQYKLNDIIEMGNHESIKTAHPFWKNVQWDDFKNLQKFIDQKIDLIKMRQVFDHCNSLEEFHTEYKIKFETIPF